MNTESKQVSNTNATVDKRQQGIIMVLAQMSKSNGDGNDGRPRQLTNWHGTIHPVCFKGHMRKVAEDHDSIVFKALAKRAGITEDEYDNFRIMESKHRGFGVGKDPSEAVKELLSLTKEEIIKHYWDHRMFGSTLLEKNDDKTKKNQTRRFISTGCTTMTHLVSVAPINIIDDQIIRRYPIEDKHVDSQTGTFGSTSVVQHGLYVGTYSYNPWYANGVTEKDLNLFKSLVIHAFGLSQSASRPSSSVIKVIHVTHPDCIGNERQFQAFVEACKPKLIPGISMPTSMKDYEMPNIEECAKIIPNADVVELD